MLFFISLCGRKPWITIHNRMIYWIFYQKRICIRFSVDLQIQKFICVVGYFLACRYSILQRVAQQVAKVSSLYSLKIWNCYAWYFYPQGRSHCKLCVNDSIYNIIFRFNIGLRLPDKVKAFWDKFSRFIYFLDFQQFIDRFIFVFYIMP